MKSTKGAYGPIDGYSYYNMNRLVKETYGSWGTIEAWTQKGAYVPTGYIGVLARFYKEGGALCLEGIWEYNGKEAKGWAGTTGQGIAKTCGGGNYYNKGASRAWTGVEYVTYSSFNTPYLYI